MLPRNAFALPALAALLISTASCQIGLGSLLGSSSTTSTASTSPASSSKVSVSSSSASAAAASSSTSVVPTSSTSATTKASSSAPASSAASSSVAVSSTISASTSTKVSSSTTIPSSTSVRSSSSSAVSSAPASSSGTSASTTVQATSTYALPAASPSKTSVPAGYMRGVNLGGWLVIEAWMDQVLLNGTNAPDEAHFDAMQGSADKLQHHWSTYFTADDVAAVAAFGMNALRIPIGYWSFGSFNANTTYLQGAQYWLDQAIGWARQNNLMILLDIHGSPGSQNGWDHSGDTSLGVAWQQGSNSSYMGPNLQQTIKALQLIAQQYGSSSYSDVIFAIEIVNEPICWGNNDFSITKNWASTAYNAMMAVVTNPNLQIITHDSFMGPQNWWDLASAINSNLQPGPPQFAVDVHLYQNMVSSDNALNVTQHVQKACNWGNNAKSNLLPWYVGEFSAATDVCVNPDGSSFAPGEDGSQSCSNSPYAQPGCQCTNNVSVDKWSPAMKNTTRMYWEAQLQAFEHAANGYFLWSLHGFGAWSLVDLINYNIIGPTIDDRNYGAQCNFTV